MSNLGDDIFTDVLSDVLRQQKVLHQNTVPIVEKPTNLASIPPIPHYERNNSYKKWAIGGLAAAFLLIHFGINQLSDQDLQTEPNDHDEVKLARNENNSPSHQSSKPKIKYEAEPKPVVEGQYGWDIKKYFDENNKIPYFLNIQMDNGYAKVRNSSVSPSGEGIDYHVVAVYYNAAADVENLYQNAKEKLTLQESFLAASDKKVIMMIDALIPYRKKNDVYGFGLTTLFGAAMQGLYRNTYSSEGYYYNKKYHEIKFESGQEDRATDLINKYADMPIINCRYKHEQDGFSYEKWYWLEGHTPPHFFEEMKKITSSNNIDNPFFIVAGPIRNCPLRYE